MLKSIVKEKQKIEGVEKETKELTLDDKAKTLIKKLNEVVKEQNINIKLRR